MDRTESLNHSKSVCKYHVVFIPKRRRKTLYGALRKYLGEVFHRLARQKESQIEEGHLMPFCSHSILQNVAIRVREVRRNRALRE